MDNGARTWERAGKLLANCLVLVRDGKRSLVDWIELLQGFNDCGVADGKALKYVDDSMRRVNARPDDSDVQSGLSQLFGTTSPILSSITLGALNGSPLGTDLWIVRVMRELSPRRAIRGLSAHKERPANIYEASAYLRQIRPASVSGRIIVLGTVFTEGMDYVRFMMWMNGWRLITENTNLVPGDCVVATHARGWHRIIN